MCLALHAMNGKNNTWQFNVIAESARSMLGNYYDVFLAAPKYLLISGGPARMTELVNGIEKMLVCHYIITSLIPT